MRRHRSNNSWDWLIACKVGRSKPRQPLPTARLTITRHAHRMLDYDGLVGSLKPVVDALVSCGVIQDDSWGVTGPWTINQVFKPKSEGQLLEILVESGAPTI